MDINVVLVITLESIVLSIVLVMMMMVVVMMVRMVVVSVLHNVITAIRADNAIAGSMAVQIGVVENAIVGVSRVVASARV